MADGDIQLRSIELGRLSAFGATANTNMFASNFIIPAPGTVSISVAADANVVLSRFLSRLDVVSGAGVAASKLGTMNNSVTISADRWFDFQFIVSTLDEINFQVDVNAAIFFMAIWQGDA